MGQPGLKIAPRTAVLCGHGRFKRDPVAEPFQMSNEPTLNGLTLNSVEMVRPKILVDSATAQEVIGNDQEAMANGDRGLFLPRRAVSR